ncbi:MAG: hypothetical protein J6O51_00895 [Bacteroidales bacterium]|nr:hypothetical protein [Bacteroidales bacterium]
MNQDIHDFLTKADPDFISGFSLFCKYSPNESLISYIGRKTDMEMLLYELHKLDRDGFDKPNPRAAVLVAHYAPAAAAVSGQAAPAKPASGTFKTFDERRTRRADLPEDLQKVYDDIAEDYKVRRALHDKMKAATADADRASFRARILEAEARIQAGWARIDAWLELNAKKQAADTFNEKSCRAYISKALKSEKVSETVAAGVKARVLALKEHSCVITDETIAAIRAKGIEI